MQIDIKHPHDSIFKNVFDDIDNTKDLLKAYLPTDLVREIDFETMKHAPTEKRDMDANKTHFDLSVECLVGETKSRTLGSGDENKLLRKELLKYQTQKQGQSNGKKTKAKYGRFSSYSK